MKMFLLLSAMMMTTLLTACGDKSGGGSGSTTPTTPLASQYYTSYKGQCLDDHSQQVDATYCEGLEGYYEVNGYCYSPQNLRVSNDFCQKYPSRVRPYCESKEYYFMKRGKRIEAGCYHRGGCRGRHVYERDGRITFCRS